MSAHPTPRMYLPTEDAAVFTGLSTSYLNKLRARGKGPRDFIRVGKRVLYRTSGLEEWMNSFAQAKQESHT